VLAAGVLLAMICAALSVAHAQNTSPKPPDSPALLPHDPAAMKLRAQTVSAYRGLTSYRARMTQKEWKTTPAIAATTEITFRFRRPNRLYLNVDYPASENEKRGPWHLTFACDGKTLTLYDSSANEFQRIKAPPQLGLVALPHSLSWPEFDILLRGVDPFAELDKTATTNYRSAFESSPQGVFNVLLMDAQQNGVQRSARYRLDPKDHLLRSLTLTTVVGPSQGSLFPSAEQNGTIESVYLSVEANPRLADADFAFTPPADAKEKAVPKPARNAGKSGK
jgi:outer membrane lipoprotein-sorting protein